MPASVINAMQDYLLNSNSNIEGEFELTVSTDRLIAKARQYGGAFVGGDPVCVTFGQNMTSLNFNLSRALGRTLQPGDEIITTTLDHDGNVAPWILLARDRGLVLRTVGVTEDLDIDLDDLRSQLNERTKVVAFTLASNAVGTLTRAREVSALAHQAGALAWADAVAFAPHRRIDVTEIGCDVLLCSPYKFFGPHLGMSWMRPGPRRDAAGRAGAPRRRQATGAPLRDRDAVTRGNSRVRRRGRLSRLTRGWPQSDQPPRRRLRSWNGNFYALGVVEHLGLEVEDGLLRAGIVHYNTAEEVDRFLAELASMLPRQ